MSAPELRCDALDHQEARDLTDRIKADVEAVWGLIVQAYQQRAWAALGYASWDAYTHEEFRSLRLRLPREERSGVVASLRDAGLSIRAIAAATGFDKNTVQADLAQVSETHTPGERSREAEDVPNTDPLPTIGLDGKKYRRNQRPKRGSTPAEKNDKLRDGVNRNIDQIETALDILEWRCAKKCFADAYAVAPDCRSKHHKRLLRLGDRLDRIRDQFSDRDVSS